MAPEERSSHAEQRMSWTVTVVAVGLIFALNLSILGYALWTVESAEHHGEATVSGMIQTAVDDSPGLAARTTTVQAVAVDNPFDWPDERRVRKSYIRNCSACHGLEGHGDGPAAPYLLPRPRNFAESPFHFVGSGSAAQVVSALRRTIGQGVPHSAMIGWEGVLSDTEIAGLARYVNDIRVASGDTWPVFPADPGERPPFTADLVAKGKAMYLAFACNSCHGESGRGDGPSSHDQLDFLGNPARPADLATGLFKSGQAPEDLCRTILTGIPGTPMASFQAVVTRENDDGSQNVVDAWALVAYIMSLAQQPPRPARASGAGIPVVVVADGRPYADPARSDWLGIEPTVIALKPLQQGEHQATTISVRSVRDAARLALYLEWRDETKSTRADGLSAVDAVAVMFSTSDGMPALPVGARPEPGTPQPPVSTWQWSAGRDRSGPWYLLDTGAPADPAAPSIAQSDKDVSAKALWTNGQWRVVLVRSLTADLAAPGRIPISIALRNAAPTATGREQAVTGKLITAWHWLDVQSNRELADALGGH